MLLCSLCQKRIHGSPRIVVRGRVGTGMRRQVDVLDVIAVHAEGKGLTYFLDGERLIEDGSLSAVCTTYRGVFLRVRRDWAVRPDLVTGQLRRGKSNYVMLAGLATPVPVARRGWGRVAKRLGLVASPRARVM